MNSTRPLSHGLMLGVCVLVGSLFAVGARASSAFADPQPDPNRTAVVSDLPKNWSKKLPSASRFTVLSTFADAAVQDDETGLVWEKTLETTQLSWAEARAACADKDVGGRKGWRLPSISELASLVDPSMRTGSTLPLGHPLPTLRRTYIGRQRRWQAIRTVHGSSFSTPAR